MRPVARRGLYHGCSRPSPVQNRPCRESSSPAMTSWMPWALSFTEIVARGPPMSVPAPGRVSCEPCLEKRRTDDRARYAAGIVMCQGSQGAPPAGSWAQSLHSSPDKETALTAQVANTVSAAFPSLTGSVGLERGKM